MKQPGRNVSAGRRNGGGTFVVVNLLNFITSGKKDFVTLSVGRLRSCATKGCCLSHSFFYSYVFLSFLCLVREGRPCFCAKTWAASRYWHTCSTVGGPFFEIPKPVHPEILELCDALPVQLCVQRVCEISGRSAEMCRKVLVYGKSSRICGNLSWDFGALRCFACAALRAACVWDLWEVWRNAWESAGIWEES